MTPSEIKADSRYSSRKFLLALLVVVTGTVLTVMDLLTPLIVELFKWTCGLYFGLNVTQKGAELIAQRVSRPE